MKICKKLCNYRKAGIGSAVIGIGVSFLPINIISVELMGNTLLTTFLLIATLFFVGDQVAHSK